MRRSKYDSFAFESFVSTNIEDSISTLQDFISPRAGERKLGEDIGCIADASVVILGICEDIGPRANLGNAGSTNAFDAFLEKFLNMQSNAFLNGRDICIPGRIIQQRNTNNLASLRKRVAELDDFVQEILNDLLSPTQTLIVIGGGHNNAYPIIKSMQRIHNKPHAILNIDPHADCRPLEGRHSGNPFSYALNEDAASAYCVLGLHEQYNSEAILDFLTTHNCIHSFFENYLMGTASIQDDVASFFMQNKKSPIGIEIDLDCIKHMPSSAYTPSGFSVNEVRSIVQSFKDQRINYFHLPEGAPTNDRERIIVGKALAYIVSDFLKTQL